MKVGAVMLHSGKLRKAHLSLDGKNFEDVFNELSSALFWSLPRSDQRRKGTEYLYGLLGAAGRKSIRNIATLVGDQATEQSLHHFISDSTWDWRPVRSALSSFLGDSAPCQAWVLRPMIIPKAGSHSVGVSRRFCPTLRQAMNAQQAIGVWHVSDDVCGPVNWRLHLTQAWLTDSQRRSQAAIPDGVRLESLSECVVRAYLDMPERAELPVRPVVADAREMDAVSIARALKAAGVPFMIRVGGTVRLAPADKTLPGHSTDTLSASDIMAAARGGCRPVNRVDRDTSGNCRISLTSTVRVRIPASESCPATGDLMLLGVADIGRPWPRELWLTGMTTAAPATLLRLTELVRRVDQEFADVADEVGIRDFAGRSYGGWHRHVTLASAAHAIRVLASLEPRTLCYVS
jgi:SRSO17 transposase